MRTRLVFLVLAMTVFALMAVACGGDEPAPAAPPPPAAPAPAPPPPAAPAPSPPQPQGGLNIAFKEFGAYQGYPGLAKNPAYAHANIVAYEGLFGRDLNKAYFPRLVEDWSVSPDNVTWTFKLKKGVQFHGGWGEMTAADVLWSIPEFAAEGSAFPSTTQIKRIFQNPEGLFTAPDDYTLEVDTGTPQWDVLNFVTTPGAVGAWVVSKKQAEELVGTVGPDAANSQVVGTGPWEMKENRTGEFWKFEAVANHHRKTPEFAQLTFFEVPEESTRIANFQVGKIDTFAAAPDTLASLAKISGTKFMSQLGNSQSYLGIYGSWYTGVGTPDERPGWDPGAAYISSNPDPDSPEWDAARKVRLAMAISIDRDKIIKELLGGDGAPLTMWGWMGFEGRQPPEWKREFDVEGAKQLLKEAGYEDGFEVEITPAIRGAPAEVEACEAVADMWADIGITARIQRIPFGTLLEGQFARTNKGVICHAGGPQVEPIVVWGDMYNPEGNWSSGVDHPFITPRLKAANDTFDPEERWRLVTELASWMWDNALNIGLYGTNTTYPLGPRLDSWAEHLETGDPRRLSAFEWAKPRQ